MSRAVLVLALLAAPDSAVAQRLSPNPFPRVQLESAERSRIVEVPGDELDTPRMVFGGIMGGFAGLTLGALALRSVSCDDELDCLDPAVYAAAAGEALGVALGVHLANGARGRFGPAAAVSLAIGGVGIGAAILADEPRLLLAIPVAQIAAAIHIEGTTSEDR